MAQALQVGRGPDQRELQAYVDDAFQLQSGVLTIVGDRRTASYAKQTFQYASGALCSMLEQKYGYFEVYQDRVARNDT